VHDSVWPRPLRRTRRLHGYGLEVLLRLDQDELATFFDAFFDLCGLYGGVYLDTAMVYNRFLGGPPMGRRAKPALPMAR